MRQMFRWSAALAVAAAVLVPVPGHAGPRDRKRAAVPSLEQRLALAERAVARAERAELGKAKAFTHKHRAAGDTVARRVARLATLDWHDDLTSACADARRTGKPILWIQALGTLEGEL